MDDPATYCEAIRRAYEGEMIGEKLYRTLATRAVEPHRKAKLNAIADVEKLTYERLQPVGERLGIRPREAECAAVAGRRADELAALGWPDFIARALRDWPPFIERFNALVQISPPVDEPAIRLLAAHEIALVEFARLESADEGGSASLRVLKDFLLG